VILLRAATDLGSPEAQCQLGTVYLTDAGLRDEDEAIKLLTQACDAGHAHAMWEMGYLHAIGRKLDKDLLKARRFLLQAARGGSADAQCQLGLLHLSGEGMAREYNIKKALHLMETSVGQKCTRAMLELAQVYTDGTVDGDWDKAIGYVELAAKLNDKDAIAKLKTLREEGLLKGPPSSGVKNGVHIVNNPKKGEVPAILIAAGGTRTPPNGLPTPAVNPPTTKEKDARGT